MKGLRWTEAELAAYCAKGKTTEPKITEQDFQRWIVNCAIVLGWSHYHTWNSFHSQAGFPDLVLIRPPRIIFAEVKNATGKVTVTQDIWLTQLAKCPGVETYLWRPADMDRIGEILK